MNRGFLMDNQKKLLLKLKKDICLGGLIRPLFALNVLNLFNDDKLIRNEAFIFFFLTSYLYSKYFNLTNYVNKYFHLQNNYDLSFYEDELTLLGIEPKKMYRYLKKVNII